MVVNTMVQYVQNLYENVPRIFFLDEVLQLKKLKNIGYQFLILKIYVIKFILV